MDESVNTESIFFNNENNYYNKYNKCLKNGIQNQREDINVSFYSIKHFNSNPSLLYRIQKLKQQLKYKDDYNGQSNKILGRLVTLYTQNKNEITMSCPQLKKKIHSKKSNLENQISVQNDQMTSSSSNFSNCIRESDYINEETSNEVKRIRKQLKKELINIKNDSALKRIKSVSFRRVHQDARSSSKSLSNLSEKIHSQKIQENFKSFSQIKANNLSSPVSPIKDLDNIKNITKAEKERAYSMLKKSDKEYESVIPRSESEKQKTQINITIVTPINLNRSGSKISSGNKENKKIIDKTNKVNLKNNIKPISNEIVPNRQIIDAMFISGKSYSGVDFQF